MKEKKNKIKKDLFNGVICKEGNRQTAGITLIALVITVIVLLILATVTINLVLENGDILSKAKHGTDAYQVAKQDEENKLNEVEEKIGDATRETVTLTQEEYEMFKSQFSKNKDIPKVSINKPNTWNIGVEYDFGDGVYGERLKGNDLVANGNVPSATIMNVDEIIDCGGMITASDGNNTDLNYMNNSPSAGFYKMNNNLNASNYGGITLNVQGCKSNGMYDIWVLYTKSK